MATYSLGSYADICEITVPRSCITNFLTLPYPERAGSSIGSSIKVALDLYPHIASSKACHFASVPI